MAPKPIWRGHLRLALVSCPIALFSVICGSGGLHFHLINPQTGHRVRMVTQDAETDKEVDRQDLVKGYLITHHPQPRVPCQAPVNPRFEHVVYALGRWLSVETRAGIEATDKANSLRNAPTH